MSSFNFPDLPCTPDPAITAGRQTVAAMHGLMSGDATFIALKDAVDDLTRSAPEDHDIVIQAFDILVTEVRFLEPHTLLLRGFNQKGDRTFVVAHYTQMVARVVYLPKRGPERVITGFSFAK
jgi:hypothetical protein